MASRSDVKIVFRKITLLGVENVFETFGTKACGTENRSSGSNIRRGLLFARRNRRAPTIRGGGGENVRITRNHLTEWRGSRGRLG